MYPSTPFIHRFLISACLLACAISASAQSTISTTDKFAYAANAGWMDFRTSAADGVRVADTYLTGYAYAANFGYIHFGTAPANGHTYGNASTTDYGVNLSLSGSLTGFAYASNIGYIQFEQTLGQPRINLLTGVFTGHAYSANLGWIALATPLSALATTTIARPDSDSDGIPDAWEQLYFATLPIANATTDTDGDGSSDLAEYQAGTIPTDPTSMLRITEHSYSSDFTRALLTFTTVPIRRYRLEYDDDLLGPWTDSALGTIDPDAGATTQRLLTPLTSTTRRFFRAVAIQPLP